MLCLKSLDPLLPEGESFPLIYIDSPLFGRLRGNFKGKSQHGCLGNSVALWCNYTAQRHSYLMTLKWGSFPQPCPTSFAHKLRDYLIITTQLGSKYPTTLVQINASAPSRKRGYLGATRKRRESLQGRWCSDPGRPIPPHPQEVSCSSDNPWNQAAKLWSLWFKPC